MKRAVILLLLSEILLAAPAIAETGVFFSPGENIRETLLQEIDSTTSTLDVAIHEITSYDFARALIHARERGVKVRVVADSKKAKTKSSRINFLIQQGIPVKVLGGREREMMGHRFAIFDGKRIIVGSFDWSEVSFKGNYEGLLILQETEIIDAYQKEFDRLWREKRVIR